MFIEAAQYENVSHNAIPRKKYLAFLKSVALLSDVNGRIKQLAHLTLIDLDPSSRQRRT